jgi:hypothetical protein
MSPIGIMAGFGAGSLRGLRRGLADARLGGAGEAPGAKRPMRAGGVMAAIRPSTAFARRPDECALRLSL